MKILVTGARGQLGYDICRILSDRNIEHRGADIADFDITDRNAVWDYIAAYRPDAVIHCAGYTAVDRAEDDQERCLAINAHGTENIAKAAASVGAKLMYISTDYVFEGTGDRFYSPNDPTHPLSVYGNSKQMGEKYVREATDKHFIVRISWLFGKNGGNFVKTILKLAKTRPELNVVCDQIGSPTYSYDLAGLLCDMVVSEKYGTYHATNEGVCSWAELAAEALRLVGSTANINPIPASEYPSRATRPYNSRLDKSKLTEAGFARLPDWKDALARYLTELKTEEL